MKQGHSFSEKVDHQLMSRAIQICCSPPTQETTLVESSEENTGDTLWLSPAPFTQRQTPQWIPWVDRLRVHYLVSTTSLLMHIRWRQEHQWETTGVCWIPGLNGLQMPSLWTSLQMPSLPELLQMVSQGHEIQEGISVTFLRLQGQLEESQSLQAQDMVLAMRGIQVNSARAMTTVENREHGTRAISGGVQGMSQSLTTMAEGLNIFSHSLRGMPDSLRDVSQTQVDIAEAFQSLVKPQKTIAEGLTPWCRHWGASRTSRAR
ncbi:uncharacterized protein LOC119977325 [Scyliorhinus canicula]|uniref:uncharacterized protein LOC119977325 n=1 Tax=Scyliorhinus canicula TaxID=7830 RepID=UPI0018F738F2|nr:uncharacterized protein LOC119977325 [Scyliorhinus canicula]XP_038674033.1 uncharacterized protein LOC119977325 [Scyliorhinus canicula]